MNKQDIIRMAREAAEGMEGFTPKVKDPSGAVLEFYERFAALVASAERERILDICKEGLWDADGIRYHLDNQERGQA